MNRQQKLLRKRHKRKIKLKQKIKIKQRASLPALSSSIEESDAEILRELVYERDLGWSEAERVEFLNMWGFPASAKEGE